MRSALSLLLGIGILSILGIAFLLHSQNVSAAPATHIVISQIQVTGNGGADDEFVELYNPTSNPVDLSGWRLRKETSGGSFSNIVASMSGTVPAHGYFLIAFPGEYTGSVTPDLAYSATSSGIANNNTVLLYSDAAVTLVDKVGMGTATDFETAAALQPATGGSIQRQLDETNGHGKDTDNNSLDFEALETSSPRNSSTIVSPSPTPTVVPTITPTNSPTNSPSPTNIPSPTASPMPASPTPTSTPTLTPTSTPSPTITITPSISPTPGVPTPTPKVITSGPIFKCTIHYRSWRFFHKTFFFPFIVCERASN